MKTSALEEASAGQRFRFGENWRRFLAVLTDERISEAEKSLREMLECSSLDDWIDWLGGYPYEFARPEEIFDFYRARGFVLQRLRTTNDIGVNEFVFRRASP